MAAKIRYTSHQTARSSRPDAVDGSSCYLIKNVSTMRLTYQVQLLTELAAARQMTLVLVLPAGARTSADLDDFVASNRALRVRRAGA